MSTINSKKIFVSMKWNKFDKESIVCIGSCNIHNDERQTVVDLDDAINCWKNYPEIPLKVYFDHDKKYQKEAYVYETN